MNNVSKAIEKQPINCLWPMGQTPAQTSEWRHFNWTGS